jgi:hypothetical protein
LHVNLVFPIQNGGWSVQGTLSLRVKVGFMVGEIIYKVRR